MPKVNNNLTMGTRLQKTSYALFLEHIDKKSILIGVPIVTFALHTHTHIHTVFDAVKDSSHCSGCYNPTEENWDCYAYGSATLDNSIRGLTS